MMTDPKIMPRGRRARTPSLGLGERPRASSWASPQPTPVLRFSPTAWAKLLCLRGLDDCEVGAFGISAADDLLCVEDVQLVQQLCDLASVAFDDESVADFFDRQVDAGRRPEQFARIWIHTHPGSCPQPSSVDEETFARAFGRSEWAVMFILAQGGKSYARLEFHVGPGGSVPLPVEVDYSREFAGSDRPTWREQYQANVLTPMVADVRLSVAGGHGPGGLSDRADEGFDLWMDPLCNDPATYHERHFCGSTGSRMRGG